MPATNALVGWADFMKTGGPYAVIIGLLFAIYKLVDFIQKLLAEKNELSRAHAEQIEKMNSERVQDLQQILNAAADKQSDLTAVLTKLSTLIEAKLNRRKTEPENG